MKKRIFVLSFLLVGCASQKALVNPETSVAAKANLVDLFVEHRANAIELMCSPISEDAGKRVDWVQQCNELAFKYLSNQQKNGTKFQSDINNKPFGMAGDFVGRMLLSNPANFSAINLTQKFVVNANKS
jgi:hypothetical protein